MLSLLLRRLLCQPRQQICTDVAVEVADRLWCEEVIMRAHNSERVAGGADSCGNTSAEAEGTRRHDSHRAYGNRLNEAIVREVRAPAKSCATRRASRNWCLTRVRTSRGHAESHCRRRAGLRVGLRMRSSHMRGDESTSQERLSSGLIDGTWPGAREVVNSKVSVRAPRVLAAAAW